MRNFTIGVLLTLAALILGGLAAARLGLIDTTAVGRPGGIETYVAIMALDSAVGRGAAGLKNPLAANDAELIGGMQVYAMNCASCHGALDKKPSALGRSFYPPVPQLIVAPLDDPDAHIYFVVKNGIRWTGMPAWGNNLSDADIWRVSMFLGRVRALPPAVQEKMPPPTDAPSRE
jgi:mono/diheme cytochrome c family protein